MNYYVNEFSLAIPLEDILNEFERKAKQGLRPQL
jgi:hypothetical protein